MDSRAITKITVLPMMESVIEWQPVFRRVTEKLDLPAGFPEIAFKK